MPLKDPKGGSPGSGTTDATARSLARTAQNTANANKTKLDTVENNATADQTPAEIISAIEGETGDDRLDATKLRNFPAGSGADQVARDAAADAKTIAEAATTPQEAKTIADNSANTAVENGVQVPARAAPGNEINGVQQYFESDFYAPDAENGQVLTANRNGTATWEDPSGTPTANDDAARAAALKAQEAADKNIADIDTLERRVTDINVIRDSVTYNDYVNSDAVVFTYYSESSAIGIEVINNRRYDADTNAASATWRTSGTVPARNAVIVRVKHGLNPFEFAFSQGAGPIRIHDFDFVGEDDTWNYYFVILTGTSALGSNLQKKVHDVHTRYEGELGGPGKEKLDTIDDYPLYNDVAVFPPGIPDANWPDHLLLLLGERLRPGTVTGVTVNALGQVLTLDDSGAKDGVTDANTGHAMLRYTISSQIQQALGDNSQVGDAPKNIDVTFTLEGGDTYRHRIKFAVQDVNFDVEDTTARDAAARAQTTANSKRNRFETPVGASPAVLPAGTHTIAGELLKSGSYWPFSLRLGAIQSTDRRFVYAANNPSGIQANTRVDLTARYDTATRTLTYSPGTGSNANAVTVSGIVAIGEA